MKRGLIIPLGILLALSVGACGKFNPMSLFSKENKTETSSQPPEKNAPAVAGLADLSGSYLAQGTNPGGQGRYKGTTVLKKISDNRYQVHWEVGTIYDGEGTFDGKVLTVEWGPGEERVGKVTYTLQEDGSLKGTWFVFKDPSRLGTETLVVRGSNF